MVNVLYIIIFLFKKLNDVDVRIVFGDYIKVFDFN